MDGNFSGLSWEMERWLHVFKHKAYLLLSYPLQD